LSDGHFTGAASISSGAAWTAPMIEGNGIVALWVWTTDEAGGIYSVPPGYTDYRDLDGDLIAVTAGGSIAISTEPVMLEQLTAQ
jgi:ABC-type nitrate/sulfonate/bicarbonate transport system substrate-binding protein